MPPPPKDYPPRPRPARPLPGSTNSRSWQSLGVHCEEAAGGGAPWWERPPRKGQPRRAARAAGCAAAAAPATAAKPAASGASTKLRCRPPRARGFLRWRLASPPRPARLPPLPLHLRPRMGEWAKTGDDERGTRGWRCQVLEGSGKRSSRGARQRQRRSRAKQAWCAAKLRRRCSDVVCTIQLMGRAQPMAVPRCLAGSF
jgi:hypothetical protein